MRRPPEKMVTVPCKRCGVPRELTTRQARRAGLCHTCLHPPRIKVTDRHLLFWLERFDDRDLAEIASEVVGYDVPRDGIAKARAIVMGSLRD